MMRSTRSAFFCGFALVLLCAALIALSNRPPRPVPVPARHRVFGRGAMEHVRAIATRRLELRIRPAPETHWIRLRALDTHVLSAAVDGRAIDTTRYRTRPPQWTLGYVDPPLEGFVLTFSVPTGRPVEFDVIARSLGLPRAIKASIPARPPDVVPIHSGDQTVVHRRVRL